MSMKAFEVCLPGEHTAVDLGVVWATDEEQARAKTVCRELGSLDIAGATQYMASLRAMPRPDLEEVRPQQFLVFAHLPEGTEYVGLYSCAHAEAAAALALEEGPLRGYQYSYITNLLEVIQVDHEVRSDPVNYELVQTGQKTFEIRSKEAKEYKEGQVIVIREWSRDASFDGRRYSGRKHVARIGFVADYRQQPGYVVFSLVSIL